MSSAAQAQKVSAALFVDSLTYLETVANSFGLEELALLIGMAGVVAREISEDQFRLAGAQRMSAPCPRRLPHVVRRDDGRGK
jgi:hypothetical protein